jgi:hypothetical protein
MRHALRDRAQFSGTILGLSGLTAMLGLAAAPVAAAPVVAATPAVTAASVHWAKVTNARNDIIDDVGLVRGNDGILHVLWTADGPGARRIMDTPISPTGRVLRSVVIAKFFLTTDPDAAETSAGLTVAWNGLKTSNALDPKGTFTATRPRSGGSWSLASHVKPLPSVPVTSSSDTMTAGSDGKPFAAFSGTDSLVVVHLGHREVELGPTNKCCVEQAGLATDGRTGTTWITYASIIPGHMGIFARQLTASGRAAGPARLLPGSVTAHNILEPHQRVGTTSRGQGNSGVYALYVHGYPFPKRYQFTLKHHPGHIDTVPRGGGFTLTKGSGVTHGAGASVFGTGIRSRRSRRLCCLRERSAWTATRPGSGSRCRRTAPSSLRTPSCHRRAGSQTACRPGSRPRPRRLR